ncbi:sialidase family protein [Devosia rhodophyticola]|uniref:Sialidase family protein n=1 Tax=Devosia rhodophyticola TaxID=3026423 RepID=A0ABY7YZ75_9HYPH|nr:sialidase family protein [Devosia rhodophyticola]WDR06189.1 sialidase family protein [Devosia rhodophyticola]
MKVIEEVIVYENPQPLLVSRQAVFPGVVQLNNDELLALFSIGQAFDAADQRAYCCHSADNGRHWSAPEPLHSHEYGTVQQSESFKPLLLDDGTLIATGYTFLRPDALTPIVDEQTFAVLPMHNKVSFSADGGHIWSVPENIEIGGKPLEMSGPCIQLASGRVLGAAAPFHLGTSGHEGWIICSDDHGKNWSKLSTFFAAPGGTIAAWECRLCEISPGRVAVLFWAYDTVNKANLTNRLVISMDGGVGFGAAIDTGILGQAANLVALGNGELLTIHAHREAPVGLVVRRSQLVDNRLDVIETLDLFADAGLGSDTSDIRKQFGSLKFGQPSLLELRNGEVLATCWMVENGQHVIKSFIVEL